MSSDMNSYRLALMIRVVTGIANR